MVNKDMKHNETNEQSELVIKFIDAFSEPNPTPEQKLIKALVKTALLSDNLVLYIGEVSKALQGVGKVNGDTVKGMVEFVKAQYEVQIRNLDCSEEDKDVMVKQEIDRLIEAEVWTLGALAHLGLLQC